MKSLGVLWLIVFISLMGFGVTTVPFPLVAEQMGASDLLKTFGGAGVFSVFQLAATPLWGRLSDAYGRKPILVVSLVGAVISYLWLAEAHTLVPLLVARALGGIMSGNLSAAFAYATDVTETKNRARGIGIVASAFGLGFALGPPIGGFLGSTATGHASLHAPALASALLAAIALVGALFVLKESLAPELRKPFGRAAAAGAGHAPTSRWPFAAVAGNPVLLGLIVTAVVVATGSAVLQSVLPFWGRDLFGFSLTDIGLLFMLFALLSAVGQAGLVGPLVKRFGEKRTAIAAIIGVTAGLLVLAVAADRAMVWIGMATMGLANGMFLPSVSSLVSFQADPRARGVVMGTFNSASSAGRIIGPAVSGPIYFSAGHAAPFLASALCTSVGVLLLARARTGGAAPGQRATPDIEVSADE
jgi:DHA1 family tetracycline resistance protein-like MFS transporter